MKKPNPLKVNPAKNRAPSLPICVKPPSGVGQPVSKTAWSHAPYWELCERRLALSAMPWMPWDVSSPDALVPTVHNMALACDAFQPTGHQAETTAPPQIEQQLNEAHSQTGWNQVHSQFGITGKGQTVAVIDSGIAFDHVALGKGFGPGYKVVGGWDFAENDARPYDDAPAGFHGTHVAGIIGANDGVHFGVAPNVDLVALRVFNDSGKGELAWAENALKWVHTHRNSFANPITTVNLSLGAAWNSSQVPTWGTLEDEFSQLQQDGIVVVVSAGNAFQQYKTPGLSYPAASPFVIPVSSIDASGQLSDFSQRDSRSIAAPGRAIESTVPDYFYGKDGINNDWANASGTSMASPYIAGASVLIREAMEMTGVQNITPQSIYEHLRSTANSIWDSVTQRNYHSLDLDRAIESLIPKDTVGDSLGSSQSANIQNAWHTEGWLNSLGDRDVYKLSPSQSGTISVQLDSEYVDSPIFSILRGSESSAVQASHGKLSFSVVAGESIGLSLADLDSIGPFRLNWNFLASPSGGGDSPSLPTKVVDLGSVDLLEQSLSGASRYRLTAEHSGLLSIVVDAGQQTSGLLQVFPSTGTHGMLTDSTVENNQWRIDLNVVQGQRIEFALPGANQRNVQVVNLLEQQGSQLTIHGTEGADRVAVDLRNGLTASVAGVSYRLDANGIGSIVLGGELNNDSLSLFGSSNAEKVELKPGLAYLANERLSLNANGFESVQFVGGGGPDRAYLYDAATDDRLNVWPNKAELTGVGYSFSVDQVNRIFVHAVQGGDDQAFVFDSVGDDTLSVRPQFTSLSGPAYFNYVAGFERVFAYASAGGVDRASLYDSVGDDLLSSSSEVTSIVGSGFSTFARGFENVEAYASAGGIDRASIFAPTGGRLTSGPDYVGMQDNTRSSMARNFERIETFISGQSVPTPSSSLHASVPIVASNETSDETLDAMANGAPILSNMAPTGSTVPHAPASIVLSATQLEVEVEKTLDWVSLLIEEELPQPNAGRSSENPSTTMVAEDRLDLSWLDSRQERTALDQIFANLR
jgi:hypothetical protein